MSFFFILSGFVLTWSYREGDSAKAFYRRRAARIIPAYFVACTAGVLLHVDFSSKRSIADALPSFVLLQSWIPNQHVYFAGNGVLWSLSCEAFFYATFPLAIIGIIRLSSRAQRVALIGIASLIVIIGFLTTTNDDGHGIAYWPIYIAPPTRLLEFVVGILVALQVRSRTFETTNFRLAAVAALATYAAAGWVPLHVMWVSLTVAPFAWLIGASALADLSGRDSLLHHRLFVKLGEWSFSFYLVHQMVITFIHWNVSTQSGFSAIAASAAALMISLVCGYLLFSFVEKPWERRLRGDKQLPVSAGGVGHGETIRN